MPWVTLRAIKNLRDKGISKTYHPGDSVQVGRQAAMEWILDGSAVDPFGQMGPPLETTGEIDPNYGVRIRCNEGQMSMEALAGLKERVEISYGPPAVPYQFTFIWRPDKVISPQLMNYGFLRIMESWEMAACLISSKKMARNFGLEEEQRETDKVIGDLRLPVYESRMIWARQGTAAEAVIEDWARQLEEGADEYHAFLRALYTKRAMLCTMPYDWKNR